MLLTKRYLYVAFMSHQTIEKIFKAYFVKSNNIQALYKHSLSYIAKKNRFISTIERKSKKLY
jgi:HEPN domain-containing protein